MGLMTNFWMRRRTLAMAGRLRKQHGAKFQRHAQGPTVMGEVIGAQIGQHFGPREVNPNPETRNPYNYATGGEVGGREMWKKLATEEAKQAVGELQRALNARGHLSKPREAFHGLERENHDMRIMFMEALRNGYITNVQNEREMMRDFHTFLTEYFENLKQKSPEFAGRFRKHSIVIANEMIKRFEQSFSPQEFHGMMKASSHFIEQAKLQD